jgi:hypothetical protein
MVGAALIAAKKIIEVNLLVGAVIIIVFGTGWFMLHAGWSTMLCPQNYMLAQVVLWTTLCIEGLVLFPSKGFLIIVITLACGLLLGLAVEIIPFRRHGPKLWGQ